ALVMDAIIYEDEIQVQSNQDPVDVAKTHIKAESESMQMGPFSEKIVYGNGKGISFIEKVDAMTKTLQVEKEKNEKKFQEIQKIPEKTFQDYLAIRERFMEVYMRDIQGQPDRAGFQIINEGNRRAHEGDALADAIVLEKDQRRASQSRASAYRELYGVDFRDVLNLGIYEGGQLFLPKANLSIDPEVDDSWLLLVLNAHTTRIAQGKALSDELKDAFKRFLREAEAQWGDPFDPDPNNPLAAAYWQFWRIQNEQVP
ncbi:MAG: hypothetical protein Q9214_002563, partial [Letrouitia sp. 1 TL-2023]